MPKVCSCIFAMFFVLRLGAAELPVSPGSTTLDRSPVVNGTAPDAFSGSHTEKLPALKGDAAGAFQSASDGTRFVVLRYRSSGAPAMRLHIRDMHLPAGARLFVYGVLNGAITNVAGPYEGSGPGTGEDFWTNATTGPEAVVELQQGPETISDLPFEIFELAWADVAESPSQPVSRDVRTSWFRGRLLTHEVIDGTPVFESDILLEETSNAPEVADGSKRWKKLSVAITGSKYRWPNGTIPYRIDPTMPNQYRVLDAINHWNTVMSGVVKLVPRTTEMAHLYFVRSTNSGQCASNVGMLGYMQSVWVGDSCATGNMIHEIGHAFGLWHEQSREDRDGHVIVNWSNITSGQSYNFNQNITDGEDLGAYDFGSVMHYGVYSFSANGLPTIQTIPAGIPVGQRNGLSAGDIAGIKALYPPAAAAAAPILTAVTISTNPAGVPYSVDSVQYTAPTTFQWEPGSSHTISAVSASVTGGTRHTFQGWSDGGAQTHSFTTPEAATMYKADYSVAYAVSVTPAGPGTATISPASADGFYSPNTSISISAAAATNSCFAGWSSLIPGTPAQATVLATKAYALEARFQTGSITLPSSYVSAPPAGGTLNIGVSATSGCLWTAKALVPWLHVSGAETGTGSGVLTVVADPNTTAGTRVGVVSVGGRSAIVTQAVRQ